MKTLLKSTAPNFYSFLAAVRKSAQLFKDIRTHQIDINLLRDVIRKAEGTAAKTCPLCGFHGYFTAFGSPPRWDAQCPSCGSLERHRLFALSLQGTHISGAVLHFAPEPAIAAFLQKYHVQYTSADLLRSDVDRNWNIEDVDCPNSQYDVIVCSHVLEHVNDRKALQELHRILRPGGVLLVMVPIVEGCEETYEDETVTDPGDREIHFGQYDHVRVYGANFMQRLVEAGFDVKVHTAFGRDAVKFGLPMGEKLFFCRKAKPP
jgi:SAM-dependent methyltransferase